MKYLFFSFMVCFLFSACRPKDLQVGESVPEFSKMMWLQSPDLQLNKLQDKVILLRWWTDGCIFCIQSADALNEWYKNYKDSGFLVIGLYHPKPDPRDVPEEDVREFVIEKGFQFPIALDLDWANLRRFWLQLGYKEFTSASFLIGKNGKIKYIHPGGEYHKEFAEGHEHCVSSFFELEKQIQNALRESFH